jgi:methionyl-tRNA formyltransferase
MSNKKLKIIFMGTPEFAVASLDILVKNNFNIVAVITSPDKPSGRGQKIQMSAVKEYALNHQLKILQPTNLKDEQFINQLKELNGDLQLVVAFRMLPEAVWNMPLMGTFNLHASLLPKYRGAAPINWCIINGDKESGVTTFKLTHQIDTGNILLQEKVMVNETMTAGELHDLLMNVGAELILKTVKTIDDNMQEKSEINFIKQDDSLATHASKIFKETCKINWNQKAKKIYDLIRGLSPYPTAYTEFIDTNGITQTLKIYNTIVLEQKNDEALCGTLITDNRTYIHVKCSDGILQINELQLQGKKRLSVKEFLNGNKFSEDIVFK